MSFLLSSELFRHLQEGTVIPAHPLALKETKDLDETYQKLLTNYYIEAGAGGIAVGVHTTQFEIRDPEYHLYEKVLSLAAETISEADIKRPFLKIAGICGETAQAMEEAALARDLGYHLGLVSLGGLNHYSEKQLVHHLQEIATVIPIFGFYLQPAVGGRSLSFQFWREAAEIESLYAIKIAPFNRYQTLDVVRAVCESRRRNEIALYTGNDDHLLMDLLSTYRFKVNDDIVEKRIVGGLLGHWAFWTSKAVEIFEEIKKVRMNDCVPVQYFKLANEITDANAAIFDAKNNFSGCISGIHEVLKRQGLLKYNICLNENETLSEGQLEEIDRIYQAYPHLNDDDFVQQFLQKDQIK